MQTLDEDIGSEPIQISNEMSQRARTREKNKDQCKYAHNRSNVKDITNKKETKKEGTRE